MINMSNWFCYETYLTSSIWFFWSFRQSVNQWRITVIWVKPIRVNICIFNKEWYSVRMCSIHLRFITCRISITQNGEIRGIPPIFLKSMQRQSVKEFVTKSLWQTWRQLAVFAVLLWMQEAHKAVHSCGEPRVTRYTFIELPHNCLSKNLGCKHDHIIAWNCSLHYWPSPVTCGFPSQRTSKTKLLYFLWCRPEQGVDQTVRWPSKLDIMLYVAVVWKLR